MKSAAKKPAPKSARKPSAQASGKIAIKRIANVTPTRKPATGRLIMDREVLAPSLKPRHLTYAQIRRMVAKVAPGPVIVPR